jgi:hypothetical protein
MLDVVAFRCALCTTIGRTCAHSSIREFFEYIRTFAILDTLVSTHNFALYFDCRRLAAVRGRLASVVDDAAICTPEKLIGHFFYGVRQRQGGVQHEE